MLVGHNVLKIHTSHQFEEENYGPGTYDLTLRFKCSFILQMIYMAIVLYAPSLALNAGKCVVKGEMIRFQGRNFCQNRFVFRLKWGLLFKENVPNGRKLLPGRINIFPEVYRN